MSEPDVEEIGEGEDPEVPQALARRFASLVRLAGGAGKSAALLGCSPNTINKWSRGLTKIPFYAVFRLSQEADLSLDRFAVGDESLAGQMVSQPTFGGAGADYVSLPQLRVTAAAGAGRYLVPDADEEAGEFLAVKASWLRSIGANPNRTEALTAVGDSMEPTIRDGDVLLVDRSIDAVVDNGIYIVVIAGRVVVKRVQVRINGSIVLTSDNGRYAEEVVPKHEAHDLIIEGRVRWFGRPI